MQWLPQTHLMQYEKSPFPHLIINEFLTRESAVAVLKALSNERFFEKNADLFQFKQTNDLGSSENKLLLELRTFLLREVAPLLEKQFGVSLNRKTIDLFGTLYEDTDYLLCHDDQLEGRKIAYLLYLSDFEESDGGGLTLFEEQGKTLIPFKKLTPSFNTLACFEVSEKSWHEVGEVLVQKQRITLGGWFYDSKHVS